MIAASRQTLAANIIQQLCAAALILLLPNILSKADYAQVVYVGVLLSFAAFADIGISLVYGRIVPALHTTKNLAELGKWNSTTLTFGLLTSAIYSLAIAAIFYARYENALHALLLLPVPFIIFWFSFHVGCMSAAGDFSEYRKSITWRSLGSLVALPLAQTFALTGWFIGMLIAAGIGLARLGKRLFQPTGALHWNLVREHLFEGVILSSISVLWLQLLNFARLYASMRYSADDIATYGIISAAYQSVSMLVISIFLPISVGILGRYGESEESALAFARDIIKRSVPLAIAATLFGIVTGPYVLRFCFPSYHFDNTTLTVMLLGIMFHPFFIVWGNLMVAGKQFLRYLLLIILGLSASVGVAMLVENAHGAAWGQCAGILSYTLILFLTVWTMTGHKTTALWRPQIVYLISAYLISAGILASSLWQ